MVDSNQMAASLSHSTYIPLPSSGSVGKFSEPETYSQLVPIHIVTQPSQLPNAFLVPSAESQLVIGFDCEGVDLCRHGALCIMQLAPLNNSPASFLYATRNMGSSTYMMIDRAINSVGSTIKKLAFQDAVYLVDAIQGGQMLVQACKPALESTYVTKVVHDCKRDSEALYFQFGIRLNNVVDTQIAYTLIEEQEGRKRSPDDYISFVSLLADPRYCGISYVEKEEVRILLRQDPSFWRKRPLSELMIRTAADDVRFLLYIYHKVMEKLNEYSLWRLAVRGSLYCRCFCDNDNEYAEWSPIPHIPEKLITEGIVPEEEILSVLNVPPGKMGCIIGRGGASIRSVKESCNAEILIGGSKGPPDKVFVIGAVKEVRKAEAIMRGKMLFS
ncbi:uncharacterized protein LOC18443662 isoform X2 [Amborella trichopoda]|uniref:uncharacterized protein LOC18443662 isoform X2 n=1 Tax=Amborella trichopoda TaxID=13333 RepID=UPI0005D3617D|nr:uncharacterized protein LOC18443662 isoform X2 [Amborella trichopoda]|eukprot:XP_011626855.1 uncharacterized protein LOC18443662 isoform X2 [Amborella trichopoda]